MYTVEFSNFIFDNVVNSTYYLWSPYVIGQTIIFLPCGFYLSSFFFLIYFLV